MGTSFRNGELVSLVVATDGTAVGGIVDVVAFMRLRSQRTRSAPRGSPSWSSTPPRPSSRSPRWPPAEIALDPDGEFTVGLFLPGAQSSIARDDDQPDTYELLRYDVTTESGATVQVSPTPATADTPSASTDLAGSETKPKPPTSGGPTTAVPPEPATASILTPDTRTVWLDQPANPVTVSQYPPEQHSVHHL